MRLATLPAANERMRNSGTWNIGEATLVSIHTNRQSISTPPIRAARTQGLLQPMVWRP